MMYAFAEPHLNINLVFKRTTNQEFKGIALLFILATRKK